MNTSSIQNELDCYAVNFCLPSTTPNSLKEQTWLTSLKGIIWDFWKKGFFPPLFPAGVAQGRVQCTVKGDLKVLTTFSQLSTSLEVHGALQKQGENLWKFPEEENAPYNWRLSHKIQQHWFVSSLSVLSSLLFAQELCHFCHSILFTVKILQPQTGGVNDASNARRINSTLFVTWHITVLPKTFTLF